MEQIVRTPRQLGAALQRRRADRALTQPALAQTVRRRQATISSVEAGEAGTRLSTLFDLLAALDLELVVRPRSKAAPNEIETLF